MENYVIGLPWFFQEKKVEIFHFGMEKCLVLLNFNDKLKKSQNHGNLVNRVIPHVIPKILFFIFFASYLNVFIVFFDVLLRCRILFVIPRAIFRNVGCGISSCYFQSYCEVFSLSFSPYYFQCYFEFFLFNSLPRSSKQ